MARTIKVDNEVYLFIQQKRKPGETTAEAVSRLLTELAKASAEVNPAES